MNADYKGPLMDDDLYDFNEECLYVHNELRKAHRARPLIYDKDLAVEAEKYANALALRKSLLCTKNEDGDNIGENVSQSTKEFVNYIYSGLAASVHWYSEIYDYDFSQEEQMSQKPTDHFTQVVWKRTKRAGFGRAKNPVTNSWHIVGKYYPAGNIKGKYKRNVRRLPVNLKWDDIPVVRDYLIELRTWEYTSGRKHILDSYSFSITMAKDNQGYLVKENFKPLDGEVYHVSQIFKNDITKEPRPVFVNTRIPRKEDIPKDLTESNVNNNHSDEDSNSDVSFQNEIREGETRNIIKAMITRHNLYRGNYGVEALTLDTELSKYATNWAHILSQGYFMGYSNYEFNNLPIGENIAMKNNKLTVESCNELVDNWYNENKFYFYDSKNETIKEFGHFTQLVWRSTRKIGIGIATNSEGFNYIVCFYYPPGNIRNQFKKMVPRLLV